MVIVTAIMIGVWSMIFLGALMRGMTDAMVRDSIATLTGHIQVHHTGYRNDPVVENSVIDPQESDAVLKKVLPPGAQWASRVRVNAIINNARHTAGVTFVGIDPVREIPVSFIGNAVTEGRYLKANDKHGIIVGKALADKFETKLGRKMVIMSQGTDGDIASRAFRIVGIFRAAMEATEKQFVFVTRTSAQKMLKLNNYLSEISIILPDNTTVNTVADSLRSALPSREYEVHAWQELLPLIMAYVKINDGFIYIWFVVVFIAMAFGIINTILMAVFERIREFGLLKALGMKPWWIVKGVLAEAFFMLLIGIVVGNILSVISVLYLSGIGIDLSALAAGSEFYGIPKIIYPALYMRDIIAANLVVFALGLAVSLYPAVKAARFKPVEALAHI